MLTQILNEFKKSAGAISLDQLSRKLGVEKSALEGMLETMVRQGKLREVGNMNACNGSCSRSCHGCSSYNTFANMGKTYQLTGRK